MTKPRSSLISLETTPYYHCISRCVRRAFLCGKDKKGQDFSHRKEWLVERIKLLGEVFAINIAAYAVMSNHYHLVLHVEKSRADTWTEAQIIQRWTRLYRGPALLRRYLKGEALGKAERRELTKITEVWRTRLSSISRFMSCLNYAIAYRANREDGCSGRFWEGRFKSQALKDEIALLACMAYVDLNPIRAGIAKDLPGSDFTSIQDRIKQLQSNGSPVEGKPGVMPFAEVERQDEKVSMLPFGLKAYLELLDWQGRCYHPRKRGVISASTPMLLTQLNLSEKQWMYLGGIIQKESSSMLDGLQKVAVFQRKDTKIQAA